MANFSSKIKITWEIAANQAEILLLFSNFRCKQTHLFLLMTETCWKTFTWIHWPYKCKPAPALPACSQLGPGGPGSPSASASAASIGLWANEDSVTIVPARGARGKHDSWGGRRAGGGRRRAMSRNVCCGPSSPRASCRPVSREAPGQWFSIFLMLWLFNIVSCCSDSWP